MSSRNEFIIETLTFFLNSDLSLLYKKVVLKKYINKYMNDDNKDNIMNIIKEYNQDIYDYIFLNEIEKIQKYYKNTINKRAQYYQDHKKEILEKRKQYYQENKEKENNKNKNNYRKRKEELNNLKEENEKLKNLLNNQNE